MQVQPHLFFEGRCEEALEFCRKALGAEVTMLMRYKDNPEPPEARRLFGALAEGGEVRMPLARTFFSPSFGMLADRFGVGWMILAAPAA